MTRTGIAGACFMVPLLGPVAVSWPSRSGSAAQRPDRGFLRCTSGGWEQSMDLEQVIRDAVRVAVREELRAALGELRPVPSASELLTVAQVAAAAQVTEEAVRRWIAAGKLQAKRAGRVFRVSRAALEAFLSPAPGHTGQGPSPEEAVAAALGRRLTSVK